MWTWSDTDREFAALDDFRRRMDRLFSDLDSRWTGSDRTTHAFPRTNLYDAGAELVLVAETPGVAQDDLQISATQEAIAIAGARPPDAPEGYSVHRQERAHVRFARSFALPCRIDVERVSATVKDGVLTVRMAKAAEAQPRRIAVKAQ